MSDVQDRINSSTRRIDAMLARYAQQDALREAREATEQARADAAQAKADALRRVEIADRYDPAFRAFGTLVPEPAADERPGVYRRRLFETLRHRLPSDHEWSDVRADDIPASARNQIESLVIKAAMAEGLKPSSENLPRDGTLVRRDLTDGMTGAKSINWMGRESFIKQMGREGQRVVRFIDPRTQNVIMGLPFSRRG
jgi:hypothetical protein